MTTIVPILKEYYPFWERLSADEQHTLAACSGIRSYDKGSFIRSDCDECLGVLLVLSGELRIYMDTFTVSPSFTAFTVNTLFPWISGTFVSAASFN